LHKGLYHARSGLSHQCRPAHAVLLRVASYRPPAFLALIVPTVFLAPIITPATGLTVINTAGWCRPPAAVLGLCKHFSGIAESRYPFARSCCGNLAIRSMSPMLVLASLESSVPLPDEGRAKHEPESNTDW
jgi:hypothetical protein